MRAAISFLIPVCLLSGADSRGADPKYHPDEAAAVARVKKLGGSAGGREDDPQKRVTLVRLSDTKVTDADLAVLKEFSRLEIVWLVVCEKVTDAGLEHLRGAKDLRWLDVTGTNVGDAGFAHLAGLT
jgi:hypothetical protein